MRKSTVLPLLLLAMSGLLAGCAEPPDAETQLTQEAVQTVLVEDFVPRGDADFVVDATGSPTGFDLAMRTVRPRGTIFLKSTFAADAGLNLAPLVVNEVTVIGSRCGPFPPAIAAIENHTINVIPLIDEVYRLADGPAAMERAASGDVMKVLLAVDESIPSLKKIKDVAK